MKSLEENEELMGKGFYAEYVEKLGDKFEAQAYGSRVSQTAQFNSITDWMLLNDFGAKRSLRILDVGGGRGDLLDWLMSRGFKIDRYTNIDTNNEFLSHTEKKCRLLNIPGEHRNRLCEVNPWKYDLAFCIGVFLVWKGSLQDLEAYAFEIWEDMIGRAELGTVVNFYSPWADFDTYALDKAVPLEHVVNFAKQHSDRVTVDLSHCPHVYLVTTNKKESQWRKDYVDDASEVEEVRGAGGIDH